MFRVSAVGQPSQGHAPFVPSVVAEGSDFVFIDGQPMALMGKKLVDHAAPVPLPPHTPIIAAGSEFVSVGGIPIAREGDPTQCGDVLMSTTHVYCA